MKKIHVVALFILYLGLFFLYRTALHWAAKRNHVAVVKYLLERGADKEIKNNNNEQPAQLSNMEEIRALMECKLVL